MHSHFERLGPPPFDDADRELAARFQATLTAEDIAAACHRFGMRPRPGVPLADAIYPLGAGDGSSVGSTDVGTVSWVVPTVQARGATVAIGTPGHSWQLTAQGKAARSEEHTSELQSLMRKSYAVFCLK